MQVRQCVCIKKVNKAFKTLKLNDLLLLVRKERKKTGTPCTGVAPLDLYHSLCVLHKTRKKIQRRSKQYGRSHHVSVLVADKP